MSTWDGRGEKKNWAGILQFLDVEEYNKLKVHTQDVNSSLACWGMSARRQ